jgi:Zn-dependent M28 family amino/carboxypeptidase
MKPLLALSTVLAALGLAACQRAAEPAPDPAPAPATVAQAEPAPAVHGFGPEISAEDFGMHMGVLASDEFEGRAPGGRGETLTVNYIRDQFQRLGLEPGNKGEWFQNVPMVESTADADTALTLTLADGSTRSLDFGTQMVIGTRTGEQEISIADSEMVFVGYGVVAPEVGWNDYEGLDVKGKTVVMLVNDPGFHADDESLFSGRRMTYYGRWTYKFEEAARQGATAALLIHDDEGAGYPWEVVQNSWSGPQFDLPPSVDPEPRLPAQGWLSQEAARDLFASAGLDLAEQYKAANRPGFTAVPLDAKLATNLRTTTREGDSRNVMGLIRGSETPEEVVVYVAHWDHLGKTFSGVGDRIFNGAVDNASGVAGVLEIAEAFVTGTPPKRSVMFLAVTLEESGLLGSKYYVANPSFPADKTVAVINLDAMSLVGPTRDLVVIGKGNSELDDVLLPFAQKQGRTLVEESEPHAGFFFRSDHFNFAKAGVPALYAKGGVDHVEKGREYGVAKNDEYRTVQYHKPADEVNPEWDLRGVVQDLEALYGVGRTLANDGSWPNYVEGNAFKAARDASLAAAAAAPGP